MPAGFGCAMQPAAEQQQGVHLLLLQHKTRNPVDLLIARTGCTMLPAGPPALRAHGKDRCRQLRTCAHTVAPSVQKPQGAVAVGHMFTQAVKFGVFAGSPLIGMHRNMADVACEHLPCCNILRAALPLEAPAVRMRQRSNGAFGYGAQDSCHLARLCTC